MKTRSSGPPLPPDPSHLGILLPPRHGMEVYKWKQFLSLKVKLLYEVHADRTHTNNFSEKS
jgi:hypothetical protein